MNSCILKSPVGLLELREEGGSLTGIDLAAEGAEIPQEPFARHSDLLYEAYRQLDEYFKGTRKAFDLPLNAKGTEFQRTVWRELEKIPYGETRSYEDIAGGLGKPKAVRAVGQANGRNPLIIVVPCHRVIRKSGDISGFRLGNQVKRYLLELERRNSQGPDLSNLPLR